MQTSWEMKIFLWIKYDNRLSFKHNQALKSGIPYSFEKGCGERTIFHTFLHSYKQNTLSPSVCITTGNKGLKHEKWQVT